MRHYEIVLLAHPNYEEQVSAMLEGYQSFVSENKGVVHRFEDWGLITTAHTIKKQKKAHYFLLNIECDQAVLLELERKFRFNDAVLRYLISHTDRAYKEKSVFLEQKEKPSQASAATAHANPMYTRVDAAAPKSDTSEEPAPASFTE